MSRPGWSGGAESSPHLCGAGPAVPLPAPASGGAQRGSHPLPGRREGSKSRSTCPPTLKATAGVGKKNLGPGKPPSFSRDTFNTQREGSCRVRLASQTWSGPQLSCRPFLGQLQNARFQRAPFEDCVGTTLHKQGACGCWSHRPPRALLAGDPGAHGRASFGQSRTQSSPFGPGG